MNYRIQPLPQALPDNWESLLPPSRREKVLQMRSQKKQIESVSAYLLLCEMLQPLAGTAGKALPDSPPELQTAPGGKPFLKDFPAVHFNFSHCSAAVACAVSSRPIGIDIERIRPYKPLLARKVLSEEELQDVETSPDPARRFIRYWTKKEALLKLTGEGIRSDLKPILTTASAKFTTLETEEYICTIAEQND